MQPSSRAFSHRHAFFCCVLVSFTVFQTTAQAADLLQVYRLARQRDPQLRGGQYEHLAQRERLRQAYADLLPVLAFDFDYSLTRQDILSSDNAIFPEGKSEFAGQNYRLTLTQPLLRYGSILRLGQSRIEAKRADLQLEATFQDLILRVATAYFEALAAQDELGFARAEEAAVQLHYENARVGHRGGVTRVTDLYDARARLAAVQARAIEVENAFDDALQGIEEISGQRLDRLSALIQALPLVDPQPADVQAWVAAATEQNLQLAVQRRVVEVSRREVRRQRAGRYPSLDLIARGTRQNTGGTLFGGGRDVDTREVLVQLNLPLYQGGGVSSRVREATYLLGQALAEEERLLRTATRQARAAYLGVTSAISRVEALGQSVASQELALQARQEGFSSGVSRTLDVLDAARDLFLARRDYARARYDYILNSLRLRLAVGTLGEPDIAQINQWFAD